MDTRQTGELWRAGYGHSNQRQSAARCFGRSAPDRSTRRASPFPPPLRVSVPLWFNPYRRGGMLIWTVAALFGLGVTLAAATATFYQLAKLGRRNRERLVASQLGQREL